MPYAEEGTSRAGDEREYCLTSSLCLYAWLLLKEEDVIEVEGDCCCCAVAATDAASLLRGEGEGPDTGDDAETSEAVLRCCAPS